ncbi:MAG: CinA family protein [Alphaproteobacteria bacterium]|nr:CinA family protein [Alphaproteobacteria bacterium]
MFSKTLLTLSETVLDLARTQNLKLVTAESCTGGLVGAVLTQIAGSSDVFERGFVTYSNQAKMQMLGVAGDILSTFGAVSEATARAMAEGALAHSPADVSVAITGVAGPGGGSADKPVGLVHFAAARRGQATLAEEQRFGEISRDAVRIASVEVALKLLLRAMA